MDLKSELLKSIWYAFTSLEAERSGKVSKSQLKVLSHNLYTALNIPHDPVALEEHFQDNDNGPVSDHGYMPYLTKYILAKATEGSFNKEIFDELCWTMTAKKNFKLSTQQSVCSQSDCFKLFCLFNLLSEDRYPLVVIQPELEYLLKKISTAMNQEWDGRLLESVFSQDPSLHEGLSVWVFLEQLCAGRLMRIDNKEAFSLALDDVFMEMYHNVLKKGYMLKKGHVRRNWHERWFVLKPGILLYYISEDQKEKKGEVQVDGSCVVETIPDKEGKRCLFCVKTPVRTYEMSATDQKQRVEWIQAMHTALRLKTEGKSSLHYDLKIRRREQRENSQYSPSGQNSQGIQTAQTINIQNQQSEPLNQRQDSQREINPEVSQPTNVIQQGEQECKEPDLEIIDIIQQHLEMEAQRKKEDVQEKEKQRLKQQELEKQLEEAIADKEILVAELAKMEKELGQQKKRIQELELTQQKLEEALNAQIQARLEEEKSRQELERLLDEERKKQTEVTLLQKELESLIVTESIQEETPKLVETEENRLTVSSTSLYSVLSQPSDLQITTSKTQKEPENHFKASHLRQWNVQLNRLMKPITPADKMERLPAKSTCVTHGQALTSTEFLIKYQTAITQENEFPNSQVRDKDEEMVSQHQFTTPEAAEEPQ